MSLGNETPIEQLAKLREAIGRSFNMEEVRGLAFALGVDFDNLRGEEKVSN